MIEARELHKSFNTHRVLNGVSLRIERGESVVIIGRSGGGKSILLKHLIGLLAPDAGDVLIDGQNIAHLTERELLGVRRRFGMLFQGAALFDSLTVAENVGFVLRREGRLTGRQIAEKVDAALEMVDLPGTQQKKPAELSGGMRKRVGLARAIVYEPEIVLYDEPTTGLDPIVADSINQLILRVCERLKVTSIVVTHDMVSARRLAQRILMLHDGRIHFSGTPAEVFACADPVVCRFVNGTADPKGEDL
ncbi:MAG: ABC transporter ATP-binding protein [Verrucomicrobia bacterium]|nr:ABC transporter ATP-binding protein [Verrucomicrobiota bacterium]